MALSEEIKILAFTHPALRCLEMPIYYGERIGESQAQPLARRLRQPVLPRHDAPDARPPAARRDRHAAARPPRRRTTPARAAQP
jgi:hypothetical protein